MFHKYGGANVGVTNCLSCFPMLVPNISNVKLADGNMDHAQGIGNILCQFTKLPVIYPVRPVYYFPGHPLNTVSVGDLKYYVDLKRLHQNLLNSLVLWTLKDDLGDLNIRNRTICIICRLRLLNSTYIKENIQ